MKPSSDSSSLAKQSLAGLVAAKVDYAACAAFYNFKGRLQLQLLHQRPVQSFLETSLREHYRGWVPGYLAYGPVAAATLPVASYGAKALQQAVPSLSEEDAESASFFVAGCTVGTVLATPMERTLIQVLKDQISNTEAIKHIWAKQGAAGFFRGFVPVAMREGVFFGTMFVGGSIKPRLFSEQTIQAFPQATQSCSVVVGAFLGVLTSHPADTLKAVMQSSEETHQSSSMSQAMRSVVQQHGVRGLYAGALPRFVAFVIGGHVYPIVRDAVLKAF